MAWDKLKKAASLLGEAAADVGAAVKDKAVEAGQMAANAATSAVGTVSEATTGAVSQVTARFDLSKDEIERLHRIDALTRSAVDGYRAKDEDQINSALAALSALYPDPETP